MHGAGWGHLRANVLRRRVYLDTNLGDHWSDQLLWFNLCLFFLPLLVFNEIDVIVSSHTLFTIFIIIPGCIGNLLHLKQGIRLDFVLDLCILILLVKVLTIVLFGIHQSDVLLELLYEGLWEWLRSCSRELIHCIQRC